jgi:hypothetical protein
MRATNYLELLSRGRPGDGRTVIETVLRATIAVRLGDAMSDAAGRCAAMAQMCLRTASLQRARNSSRAALRDGRLLVPACTAGNVAIAFES